LPITADIKGKERKKKEEKKKKGTEITSLIFTLTCPCADIQYLLDLGHIERRFVKLAVKDKRQSVVPKNVFV